MRRRNIALIGFMGTGKSTIGRALSRRLRIPFVDTDIVIAEKSGRSVTSWFERFGEEAFREEETHVLQSVLSQDGRVIATGGGITLREENRLLLQQGCFVVALTAREQDIVQRVLADRTRPLVVADNPKARIRTLLAARAHAYAFAEMTIDTSTLSIEEVVDHIFQQYKILQREELSS
jgi:shikimate kinase